MSLKKGLWVSDIAKNLFADGSFTKHCKDDSQYMKGKTITLPQAGTKPGVEKNRSVLPATISQRTDSFTTYTADDFTTDPIAVTDIEDIQNSYDMRKDVLEDHIESLEERIATEYAYQWAPGAANAIQYVRTTGADRAAYATGQTGTRKAATKTDLAEVKRLLDAQNTPGKDRYALLDPGMYKDLILLDDFTAADKLGYSNIPEGVIGKAFGFWIYMRSETVLYDNTGTPVKKAVGAAVAGTDNVSSLFWHKRFVRGGMGGTKNGGIKVFSQIDAPGWYGSVFSAMVIAGAKARYTNNRGVVALIEAP